MKQILLILLLGWGILAYSSEELTGVEYRIATWRDTLFIGEPLVLTNILINKTNDTIRIYDPDGIYFYENPNITITYPDGKEKQMMLRLTGMRMPPKMTKYEAIPPKDTLIIELTYNQTENSVTKPFLIKPGVYKIKGSFSHFWLLSQKGEPKYDDEHLWNQGATSNQLTIIILTPPKGEKQAAKDFVSFSRSDEEFIKKYPRSIYTPYVLHLYLIKLFSKLKYEEALKVIDRLVTDYPDFIFTKYCNLTLGKYYSNIGNKEMANKYYESFIAKYPKFINAKGLIQNYKDMR